MMADYISITEYAEKYGKDRAAVFRLIQAGRLTAQKVGATWIIPADAPPPEDRRVKSGKYRDWRKKTDGESNEKEG